MAQAKEGDTVKVHYAGKLDDGTVFDTSANRDPLEFTIGKGQLIPGFEQAVVGMNPGESKTVKLPSDKAYGPRREEMVVVMERKEFPAQIKPTVGQQMQVRQADGQTFVVMVTDMSESTVTLDANHPLAGQNLTFAIELLEVA